jgi:autophagy-related protein 16
MAAVNSASWKTKFENDLNQIEQRMKTYLHFPILNEYQLLKHQVKRKGKTDDLETQKLAEKNKELLTLNADYSSRVLRLIDEVGAKTVENNDLKSENQSLQTAKKQLETQVKDALDSLKEKNNMILVIKDDLHLHQLELNKKEDLLKEFRTMRDKYETLEFENKELKKLIEIFEAENKELHEKLRLANVPKAVLNTNARSSVTKETRLKSLQTFKNVHDQEINCIAISNDDSLVATGGNDRKIVVHAVFKSSKFNLGGASQGIMSCDFSKSGEFVLCSSNDHSCQIYSIQTQRLMHTLTGHLSKVYSARFTNLNTVVSGSHDRTIKIWDLNKGYCTKTVFTLSSCNDLSPMNADGTVLVSGHLDNNLRVWDCKSGNLIREITGNHFAQITSVKVSADEHLVSTASRDNTIKVLDTRMFQTLYTCSHPEFKVGSNWTKHFISVGGKVFCGGADGYLYIWDGNELIHRLQGHQSGVVGVVCSQNGKVFTIGDRDRMLVEWGQE